MLSAQQLSKSYGPRLILEDISFSLGPGDKVGLIGPNGCGKSTLLRLLAGAEPADQGHVALSRQGLRIGYLPQGLELPPDESLAAALNLPETDPSEDVEKVATLLAARPDDESLRVQYDSAVQRLAGQSSRASLASLLTSLGLGDLPLQQPVGLLSGGQQTRLGLARILIDPPNVLLLDEPTNHLDIRMLEWLEGWLTGFSGAALIVSHDRTFLDHIVTRILEIDPTTHRVHSYEGNYSDYLEQQTAEQQRQFQEYADWKDEILRLRRAAAHVRSLTVMKKGGKADSGDKFAKGFFAGRATQRVAKRAKAIEKRLDQLAADGHVEKPRAGWQMKLDFGAPQHVGREALALDDLTLGYPEQSPLLEGVTARLEGGRHAVLTGPNGCGKTSLLHAITGGMPLLGGTIRTGTAVHIGIMEQDQHQFDPERSPLEIIQAAASWNQTLARAFLHHFMFTGDDPLRPAGSLSYGERARLQLALLVAQGCNFLLLDEPINHLDIPSRRRFEQALAQFSGTVLAVVHDRYFIEQSASMIWLIEDRKIRTIYV